MEHLNRVVKDHVVTLGANVAESSIIQCRKSLKGLLETCSNFDAQLQIQSPSTGHTRASVAHDQELIMKELIETSRVFDYIPGRLHPTFKNIHPSIAEHIDMGKLFQWIAKKKNMLRENITKARIFNHKV